MKMTPLSDWFVEQVQNISRADVPQACHLLLCARDLGVTSHGLTTALARVETQSLMPEMERSDIVKTFLRQITLQRYGAAETQRRDFLQRWLLDEGYRGEDVVTVAWVMSLATEQKELLPQPCHQTVRRWFVKREYITALRVRGWAPRQLGLWGEFELARNRAEQLLSERSKTGNWDQSPEVNASVAYSLSQASCVSPEELNSTVSYLERRLDKGFASVGISYACNALKLLKAVGRISAEQLALMRNKIQAERSVFLSHANADKPLVRRLAEDLKRHGVRVWLDEAEIKPGESIIAKLEEGVSEMRYLFFVASKSSVNSRWTTEELRMAMYDSIQGRKLTVIPIRIDPTPLPGFLRDKKYVDLSKNYEAGLQELLGLFD
jgi:hypothetical protein